MVLFYTDKIQNDIAFFENEEMRHIQNALRKSKGDAINFTDGSGTLYRAEIVKSTKKEIQAKIIERNSISSSSPYLHIAVAPTKNIDRIEWFVEKAVEIGINEISFILCKHSERKIIKVDRMKRIALAAMKQSLKATMPTINELVEFEPWINASSTVQKMMACLTSETLHFSKGFSIGKPTTICIGPEGGFRDDEIKLAMGAGYRLVSLGDERLRTETAALTSVSFFRLLNDMNV